MSALSELLPEVWAGLSDLMCESFKIKLLGLRQEGTKRTIFDIYCHCYKVVFSL